VSLHREERRNPPKLSRNRTNAEVLVHGMGDAVVASLPDLSGAAEPLPADLVAVPAPPPDFATWAAARATALAVAGHPGAVAATALTEEGTPVWSSDPVLVPPVPDEPPGAPVQGELFDRLEDDRVGDDAPAPDTVDPQSLEPEVDAGLQKRPRDLDLPPWLKGRYGTAVGRAVHGVLQTIELATGEGLDDAVAAQCQAEAVPDRADDVRRLVQDALGSASVRAAAGAAHWREVYACTPVGDRLLEGYVDLLYRSPEGLVVVDHKTSASADPDELDRRVAGYRLQGAAYAVAVSRATAEPVTRVVFLFLTPHGAVERELTALDAAMADVERLVAERRELVTP